MHFYQQRKPNRKIACSLLPGLKTGTKFLLILLLLLNSKSLFAQQAIDNCISHYHYTFGYWR